MIHDTNFIISCWDPDNSGRGSCFSNQRISQIYERTSIKKLLDPWGLKGVRTSISKETFSHLDFSGADPLLTPNLDPPMCLQFQYAVLAMYCLGQHMRFVNLSHTHKKMEIMMKVKM